MLWGVCRDARHYNTFLIVPTAEWYGLVELSICIIINAGISMGRKRYCIIWVYLYTLLLQLSLYRVFDSACSLEQGLDK